MSEAEKGLEHELKPLQNGEGDDTPKNNSEPKFMETVKGKVIVAVSAILGILGLGLAIGLAMHFGGNSEPTGPFKYEALTFNKTKVDSGRYETYKFTAIDSLTKEPVKSADFLEKLQSYDQAIQDFNKVLATGTNFEAYYFECPPLSKSTIQNENFEFIIAKSTSLNEEFPDRFTFSDYFDAQCSDSKVADFKSLGRDAHLITPCPPSTENEDKDYSHLANFVRKASKEQILAFWKRTGDNMVQEVNSDDAKRWMSTSGDGIAWLHLRIDTRPKYYTYSPYKT